MSSGDLDVNHNKETGNKQITVKLIAWFYSLGSKTAQQDFQLDNIPRKGNFEIQPRCTNKEEYLIDVYYKPDKKIKSVQYSIKKNEEGFSWSNYKNIEVISGDWSTGATFRIKNLEKNTKYIIKVRIDTYGNGQYRESEELHVQTYDIPHIIKTSVPSSVNLGDTFKVELYNPLKRSTNIYLGIKEGGSNIPIFSRECTNLTYYDNFNNFEDLEKIYQNTALKKDGFECIIALEKPNQNSEITTYYDEQNIHFKYDNMKRPYFKNFDYKDINEEVTAITKDDKIIIKNLSNLEVDIESENLMETYNCAMSSQYLFECGSNHIAVIGNFERINADLLTLKNFGETTISVTAVDTRGLTTTVNKTINVYDYNELLAYVDLKRKNKFENETLLIVNGKYDILNINNKELNTIKSIKYRFKELNSEFNDWNEISFTAENGEYKANKTVLNLNNSKEYIVEICISDNFKSTTITRNVDSGISIFSIRTNGKCYIKEDEIVTKDQNGNISANSFNGAWNKRYAEDADSVTNSKWDNVELRRHLPSLGFLSNWDGAYDDLNRSELVYCKRGKILARPRIVFWNTNGDNSDTINFDENIKDAKRIDIYFKDTSNNWLSTSMINPIGKDVMLQAVSCSGGRNSMKYSSTVYKINENKMFVVDKGISYSTGGYLKNNELYVYEVDVWNKYYLDQEY